MEGLRAHTSKGHSVTGVFLFYKKRSDIRMYLTAMINSEIYSYDNENQAIEALRLQILEQLADDEQNIERYDLKLTKVQHGMVMNAELKQ